MMYPCFRCRYMKLMRFSNINNAKIQQVLPRPPPPPSLCCVFGTNIDIVHWMWSKLNSCKYLPTQSSASDRPAVFRAPFMFVASRLIIHINFLNRYHTIYICSVLSVFIWTSIRNPIISFYTHFGRLLISYIQQCYPILQFQGKSWAMHS